MIKDLYIVGTHHKHQFGPCDAFERDDQACDEFAGYLKNKCVAFGIKTIAEEMCSDSRAKWNISQTVPEAVAAELCLPHADCGLNEAERSQLGILNEGEVKMNGLFHEQSEEIVQANIRREHDKREDEWIRRISHLSHFPVLIVCGSDHSTSLRDRAKEQGYSTTIIVNEWTPNNRIEGI